MPPRDANGNPLADGDLIECNAEKVNGFVLRVEFSNEA